MIDLGNIDEPYPWVNFRIEICPDNRRDVETLINLIKKHVKPGSTIMTDCWKGYKNLTQACEK